MYVEAGIILMEAGRLKMSSSCELSSTEKPQNLPLQKITANVMPHTD
ncbi:hypothetical protein OKW21_003883 [Catalinimonas alkaloidigena]|nr:hypothetical protein [Catalinimonas alkaloidigena]